METLFKCLYIKPENIELIIELIELITEIFSTPLVEDNLLRVGTM